MDRVYKKLHLHGAIGVNTTEDLEKAMTGRELFVGIEFKDAKVSAFNLPTVFIRNEEEINVIKSFFFYFLLEFN